MHRNQSVMKHQFSQVPKAEIPRSSFDRSHGHKTTFNAGELIPVFCDEALPGDTFNLSMTGFARLATPIFPIMDNMYLDSFFFAVPVRLLWDNWQKFNGEQKDPSDSTDFVVPQINLTPENATIGSLHDYFGLPVAPQITAPYSVSALWHRAYKLIWNEWFRDQNMQNSVPVSTGDGPDNGADSLILRRGKRHDYFTSCLPWPQKGPGVQIPLGATAPIHGLFVPPTGNTAAIAGSFPVSGESDSTTQSITAAVYAGSKSPVGTPGGTAFTTETTNVYADLSEATAATINSLRQAFQIQKIYERDARGGTRYTELIKAHFGVTSPDSRLQRPEFLGGGSTPINISPIPQTSASGTYADSPQGNLAAMGTATMNGHGFTQSFTEHCVIIGMVCARADLTYQQGLNRMWSRKTRFDYYWPALSHLGEQAVLQKEIFATGVTAEDEKVFGYQERHAEYRYKPSQITGLFRSSAAQSLDAWHLSQEFATAPVLDSAFIEENPPVDRVIAVADEPHFLFDSYFRIKCARPMPVYGVPGLIDHF